MTSPRHLWSGDWERESAAAAEQLRRQPAPVEQPAESEPEPAARLSRARTRVALVALPAALLSAVAAFAIVAALSGAGGSGGGRPWLGVELSSSPILAGGFQSGFGGFPFTEGVEVTAVVAGGPAADAGIKAGDVIMQVGEQLVNSPAAVQSAIADMQVGDRIELRYQQGPLIYTTQVMLKARPARYR